MIVVVVVVVSGVFLFILFNFVFISLGFVIYLNLICESDLLVSGSTNNAVMSRLCNFQSRVNNDLSRNCTATRFKSYYYLAINCLQYYKLIVALIIIQPSIYT